MSDIARRARTILELATLAGALIGCAPRAGATPEPVPADRAVGEHRVELVVDRPIEAVGRALMLTLDSVSDSRCAQGVTCVWAGEVTVRIKVSEDGSDSEVSLTLGPRPNDSATLARHVLRLVDVVPYPVSGKEVPREDYRATVIVTEK